MNILGLVFIGADPSVCLLQDGKVISMVEEERIIRLKHATDHFPVQSIKSCLGQGSMTIDDIDYVTYPWETDKFTSGYIKNFYDSLNKKYNKDEKSKRWEEKQIELFNKDSITERILSSLKKEFPKVRKLPQVKFIPHHYAHAFQAYMMSKFEDSLIFTIDGSGDENSTVIWIAENNKIEKLREVNIPNSLGWFYAAFTEFLGFKAYDGEYKVMGLAAYGSYDQEIINKIEEVITYDESGNYQLNPDYIFYGKHTYSERFTDKLTELLGEPNFTQAVTKFSKNLAYAVQYHLEEVVVRMAKYWIKKTGIRKICLSGGVAMNVKMNGRLNKQEFVDKVFISYCCSDLGLSLGSAMVFAHECGVEISCDVNQPFLGPSYEEDEIKSILDECKLKYRYVENIEEEVAYLLTEQNIVGWFQGRGEVGARALGSRSILADPRRIENRDRVNKVIKQRELWRPFCPAVLEEYASEYFNDCVQASYMTMTFDSVEERRNEIPAIVHVDGTVRPQTVNSKQNKKFYNMLKAFHKLTSVPIVLNTSFNVKGEPIVYHPLDAVRCFYSTGLDVLVLGNIIVEK
jgi:carbamoyltransferase|tara:strand:+ start:203 stop:1921 length:1719 start_codon:yes stop_codon:yes gene_type:complete